MKNAFGLIFSNIHDNSLPQLTQIRTVASVPFGGRYRLIDFALSNMVNADIFNVGIITHYNYRSLMDHVGTGKDWDLARKNGGLKILPPFITAFENSAEIKPYSTRLEALIGISRYIIGCKEDYVVLSDCDCACNIDLKKVIAEHIKNKADITMVCKDMTLSNKQVKKHTLVVADKDGIIKEIIEAPAGTAGKATVVLNIMVATKNFLYNAIMDAAAHGYKNFNLDIIAKNPLGGHFRIYKYDGCFAGIGSLGDYLEYNLKLLEKSWRDGLFCVENRPILTRVRNSAPTIYHPDSKVENSLIADGCDIKGTVINSVLFRGVKVGKGSIVKNSVIMQNSFIDDNVGLNCVVCDKNACILKGASLSGHISKPFYVDKDLKI